MFGDSDNTESVLPQLLYNTCPCCCSSSQLRAIKKQRGSKDARDFQQNWKWNSCRAKQRLHALSGHLVPSVSFMESQLSGSYTLRHCLQNAVAADGGVLVNTVQGQVSSRQLGMVLPHEHCYVSSAGMTQIYPENVPLDYVIPEAVAALKQLKEAGGRTIVDCTTYDLGRNVRVMAQIAKESGINIIATTGSWMDPPRSFYQMQPGDLANLYIREATVGIEGTDIKAGIIKCAHETGVTWTKGKGFTQIGETTCRAAAIAQKATGLPITTHTETAEQTGLAQIAIFEDEGVDLNRVYIGHCNDSTDLEYLVALLRKGVWLGLDRTGPGPEEPGKPNWEERAVTIKRLIDAGWGHRIMVSHDWMVYLGFIPPKLAMKLRKANPDGYTFILRKIIPKLEEMGVKKEQINAILFDNPRRFFENSQ